MNAIETRALRKVYGEVVALDALDLEVPEGEFFGLLGPNGAGKTTTIGILTTRVRKTAGEAFVSGANVTSQPAETRQRIGVVPQRPNPDRSLRVAENLVFHATYFGVRRAEAVRRADALLDRLGIAEKRNAKVDALSGGQQQRLMIARALIHEPRVLFLDEPTVGLDPQARLGLWDTLREVHKQGRTIVMTTHYMEEADQLCDRIAIIDRGKLLALDTPSNLKAKAPGDTIVDIVLDADAEPLVAAARTTLSVTRAEARGATLRVFTPRVGEAVPAILALAESRGRTVNDIHISRPSLETLFISLTGRKLT
ncbi:MAG TPA: ATP-binding cassette domain-containing protein [Thermoanaerobaculia bacterium]|nr:ATP-binding cassette domain-containing protein [Thermoanaerobaculia bacterium]